MRTIRRCGAVVCLSIVASWFLSSVIYAEDKYVPGELLVKFKPGISAAAASSLNQEVGCEAIHRIGFIGVDHLRITSGLTVEEAVVRYSRNPNVEFAEPNYRIGLLQRVPNNAEKWPNDDTFNPFSPAYGRQWSLDNWGQTGATVDADIDAPQMWRMITAAGPDIIVAIMDTGIDLGHPDLAANIWTNPDEIPGNGVDDDENNYIDDVQGYDFVNGDNDPTDDDGHGTHVAGIIGAVGNNGIGIAGIAWGVQLMPIKVIEPAVMSDHAANVVLGIDYAMHEDAKIINMSFRLVEYSRAVALAIDRANGAGILVVAAAGNDANDNDVVPLYPASYPHDNIIAVAASDHDDELWFWRPGAGSNWGRTSVDLAAPGEEIYSTTPTYPVPDMAQNYDWATGTSMAAPHVSGVAALCWSLEPWLTYLQLKHVLLNDPTSFNAADKEKKPAFQHGQPGEVLTEGRLRAAQNADYGDAPERYPTDWPPLGWGAIHLDCGLEWLGYDVSLERSAVDFVTDTDGIPNLNPADNDGFDDGVTFFPPYFCKGAGAFDRVDVEVTVSDPLSGRYGNGKYLYLTCFFDFNDSGDWWDVSKCVLPGDAPEHLLIQAVGGPGAASVINPLPDNNVVIDPSLWGGLPTRQSRRFELSFYSPPQDEVAETIWTRFRLEYDDQVWPSPDNKFLGMEFDYSLFGEVEDYFVENPTTGRLVIEDFESYTGTVGGANPLVATWVPGGAAVQLLDPLVSHGGAQSMSIGYSNNMPTPSYSETTRTFASPQDFTAGGVRSLSIWFKGLATNAAERMYLILEDNTATGAETAHSNPLAVLDPSWQEWNIDLAAFGFVGVDLTSIQKITIGLGHRSAAGPPVSGTVWFDDFALYPPRCFPQQGPLADLTGDCIVDNRDLRIMAEDWLKTDALLVVQEPCDANLVGWWQLDADASDSSANGHHGTAQGQYAWVGGRIGSGAIEFSGTGGRVLVPDHPQLRPTDQVSASAWVYYSVNQHLPARVVVKGADNTETFIVLIDSLDEFMFHVRDPNGAMCWVAAGPLDKDEWVHLAGTYNGLSVTGYVDGRQVGSWYEPGIPLSQDSNGLAIGNRSDAMNREFIGKVDDVRVYDYGLSGAEVGWLASEGAGYIALVSPANIYDEEPLGEKAVNLRDYAVLVDQWLIEILWPP